jgi:hypothetical protein
VVRLPALRVEKASDGMKYQQEPLRFRGTPNRLSATLELPEFPPAKACRVVLPDARPLPLSVRRLRSTEPVVSTLSFRLPKSTPPGSYEGNVELGGKQIPILVDVEPRASLRFIRPRVRCKERPGARTTAELTLLNRGNVEVTVPREDSFCVFADDGIARAMYRGLAEEDGNGQQRIDRIMDELAKAHGGLVRVTVTEGSGLLAPEEVRELTVELHFSHRLLAGRTYRGSWPVSQASLEVEIEVVGESNG